MPPHLHPKNAETRLRAVEGDPFHQAGQGFAIMGGTVGDRVIHDAQSSTVDTAMPVDASGGARHGGGRTEKNGPGYTGKGGGRLAPPPPTILWSSSPVVTVGDGGLREGGSDDCLLKESTEDQPARTRSAAVEPEGETLPGRTAGGWDRPSPGGCRGSTA